MAAVEQGHQIGDMFESKWTLRLLRAHAHAAPSPRSSEVCLSAFEAKTLLVKRGRTCVLHCLEGTMWITHPGNPGDHVVSAGRVFTSTGPGELVLSAFEPTRVAVSWSEGPRT